MPTDIPNSSSKIQQESVQFRSAVSESTNTLIGGDVNYLLDAVVDLQDQVDDIILNVADDVNNGTFVAPANLYNNLLIVVGAGGGGGGAGANAISQQGGQGANYGIRVFDTIVPGNSYLYNVGTGGTGGVGANSNGNDGSDTTFTGILVGQGGRGGKFGSTAKTTTMLGLNDTHGNALRNGMGGGLGSAGDDSNYSPGGLGHVAGGQSGKTGDANGTDGDDGKIFFIWFEKRA